MIYNKFFLLFFFIGIVSFSQNIQLIEKQNFDKSNFEISIPCTEFGKAKIVALGESTHRGANTNSAKIKMVKYLHEKCGFNVLAMEACMFKMIDNDEKILDGTYTGDSLVRKVNPAWSSSEMRELYDYVVATQKTQNRLAITGFDNMFPYLAQQEVITGFYEFVENLNKKVEKPVILDVRFNDVFFKSIDKAYGYSKMSTQDTLLLYNTYKEIQGKIVNNNLKDDKYFKYWNHTVSNLRVIYSNAYDTNGRDVQMFKNLEVLMNEYYPNEKIILWGATAHFVKDSKSTDTKWHQKYDFMGDFINRKFDDKYYVMAFTALKGAAGTKGMLGLSKQKFVTKNGSVEKYIEKHLNDPDYAFMSLHDVENRKIISDNITSSSIMGTHPLKTNLLKVVDGIFYIREEGLVHWD